MSLFDLASTGALSARAAGSGSTDKIKVETALGRVSQVFSEVVLDHCELEHCQKVDSCSLVACCDAAGTFEPAEAVQSRCSRSRETSAARQRTSNGAAAARFSELSRVRLRSRALWCCGATRSTIASDCSSASSCRRFIATSLVIPGTQLTNHRQIQLTRHDLDCA